VHRLIGMFNNLSAGLYQMADTMPLSDIPAEDYAKWMTHLFRERGIELPAEFPEMIVRRFAHHPFYIQAFLHVLWEKLPSSSVKPGISDLLGLLYQIEKELIDKRRGEFEAVWEGLTLNQKRVLKLILVSQGRKVFSTQNLFKVELSAPQIANRALLSVIQKEIIIKSRIYHFADIGFKKWLQLKMR